MSMASIARTVDGTVQRHRPYMNIHIPLATHFFVQFELEKGH